MKPCMSHGWRISLHPTTPRSSKAGFLGFLFLAVNPLVPAGLLEVIQGYGRGAHNLAGVGVLLTSSSLSRREDGCLLQTSRLGERGDRQRKTLRPTRPGGDCPVKSSLARIFPSQTQVYVLSGSFGLF